MMNWDSVKNFIGDAAPIVGGLLAPATGGISVAVGRRIAAGKANWFEKKICCALKKIEGNHCQKSEGE